MSCTRNTVLGCASAAWVAFAAPLAATDTDARIVASAKRSYVYKTHLKDDPIVITSRQGQVTLTGTVRDDYHRALAEETVKGLPGVKGVDNQLRLEPQAGTNPGDDQLRAKVQATLLFHKGVSATRTRVLASGGTITLQGEAASQAQKDLTGAYVKEVDGVTRVVNEMTLAKGGGQERHLKEKIDDASLTAQAKVAILLNKSVSVLNTKVVTRGGVVTVTGSAKTLAEKQLVEKLIRNIEGVRQVRNRVTVQ